MSAARRVAAQDSSEPVPTVGGMSERALTVTLLLKYFALVGYGVWSAVVEIPTFVIVGSPLFAFVWACSLTMFAALAAVGVVRSWLTTHHRLERWTTAAFILTFLGYSSALIYRAVDTGSWASSALAILPAVVCILPTVRYYSLVRRVNRAKRLAQKGVA